MREDESSKFALAKKKKEREKKHTQTIIKQKQLITFPFFLLQATIY